MLGGFSGRELGDCLAFDTASRRWRAAPEIPPRSVFGAAVHVCSSKDAAGHGHGHGAEGTEGGGGVGGGGGGDGCGHGGHVLLFGGEVDPSTQGHAGAGGFSGEVCPALPRPNPPLGSTASSRPCLYPHTAPAPPQKQTARQTLSLSLSHTHTHALATIKQVFCLDPSAAGAAAHALHPSPDPEHGAPCPRGWFAAAAVNGGLVVVGGVDVGNARLGDVWELRH